MSKAKEKAKEYAEKFIIHVDHQRDVEEAYIDGYNQAEKDLKLTWQDMRLIDKISSKLLLLKGDLDDKGFYQEVLERFKNFIEKKEK